jgi:hypothetical protein
MGIPGRPPEYRPRGLQYGTGHNGPRISEEPVAVRAGILLLGSCSRTCGHLTARWVPGDLSLRVSPPRSEPASRALAGLGSIDFAGPHGLRAPRP